MKRAKKNTIRAFAALAFLAIFFDACRKPGAQDGIVRPFAGVDTAQVDSLLQVMSPEEKIGQLIIWQPDLADTTLPLLQTVAENKTGGLMLENLPLHRFLHLRDTCQLLAKAPLFFGTQEKVSLHNLFTGLPAFPLPASMAAIDSAGLHSVLEEHYWKQCKALGINFSLLPNLKFDDPASLDFDFLTFENDTAAVIARSHWAVQKLTRNRILAVGDAFSEFNFEPVDSLRDTLLRRYQAPARAGLTGLLVSDDVFLSDTLAKLPARFVGNYLRNELEFNGLVVARLGSKESPDAKILQGADLLVTSDAETVFQKLSRMRSTNKLTEFELDRKVRQILIAKAWISGGRLPLKIIAPPTDTLPQPALFVSEGGSRWGQAAVVQVNSPFCEAQSGDEVHCYFEDPAWGWFARTLFEKSVVLAQDEQQVVPFGDLTGSDFKLFEITRRNFKDFRSNFGKYADFQTVPLPPDASGNLKKLAFEKPGERPVAVVLLDSLNLQPGFHKDFIANLNELGKTVKTVVVNFGNPKNLRHFDRSLACLQIFERNKFTEAYAAQVLFGGVETFGKLPVEVAENLPFHTGLHRKPVRLGFSPPERAGIASERLVGIDAIAESAIDHAVFPGCQVAVAKDGQVIFSKAFGTHTYAGKQPVRTADLFDIASVTKIAATTLAVMKLWEEKKLDLNGTVGEYMPMPETSKVRNVKIRELLLHFSGLQAQIPIARYYNYRNVPVKGCNNYFCKKPSQWFNVQVDEDLFLRNDHPDTIWARALRLPVSTKKYYHYSDVNYFILQKMVEHLTQQPLDYFAAETFYQPLGLRRTTFKPSLHFEKWQIVPTEQDRYWRKGLVHGYVHDPAAALLGGVAGSAGVFSNAEDLAVLFQMMLNEGGYGGAQFFQRETVQEFAVKKHGIHRGFGFDKPANRRYPTYSRHASPETYGHTGFTGTCVWVDPKHKLVYVFLSNRVHPNARNGKIFTEGVRGRIHEVVYDAMGTFQGTVPELSIESEMLEGE